MTQVFKSGNIQPQLDYEEHAEVSGTGAKKVVILDGGGNQVTSFTLSNIALQIEYDGNSNPIYIGLAVPGTPTSSALWQIRKLTFDGQNNVTGIQYASGTPDFDKVWTDRSNGTYNYS